MLKKKQEKKKKKELKNKKEIFLIKQTLRKLKIQILIYNKAKNNY